MVCGGRSRFYSRSSAIIAQKLLDPAGGIRKVVCEASDCYALASNQPIARPSQPHSRGKATRLECTAALQRATYVQTGPGLIALKRRPRGRKCSAARMMAWSKSGCSNSLREFCAPSLANPVRVPARRVSRSQTGRGDSNSSVTARAAFAHSDAIDHRFRTEPIADSTQIRSAIGAKRRESA